jgi:hypothetical protein
MLEKFFLPGVYRREAKGLLGADLWLLAWRGVYCTKST